ncbi:MAG: aminotransferase class III-fold pyridoxal phosphate-dependent enzyme, partial [Muribaculaceae bacterium]|nr:aminotransferase class III-fold pyridoxal phosphate-dependent enzyme [Muribaculaceae bacterium]
GIYEPTTEFMQALAKECKETGTLLILDEIQSGYGRSGKFFAHQHHDVKPDIITCAKGIANGFPMGAVLISPDIEAKKGMLGTTFGGNHLACAAAIAVLDIIEDENLIENAAAVGTYLIDELRKIPQISDVRGRGLMIGFEVDGFTGSDLRKKLLFDHHIFTGGAGKMTVRLLPALNLSQNDAEKFITELKKAIN